MTNALLRKKAEYLRYGEECVEIARTTSSESQRIMLMHISETWRRLADNETESNQLQKLH
jgi:hypothetical protein